MCLTSGLAVFSLSFFIGVARYLTEIGDFSVLHQSVFKAPFTCCLRHFGKYP